MSDGKIRLSCGEVQGNLRQILESNPSITADQRYALTKAIESVAFVQLMAPGLKKVMEEYRNGTSNSRPVSDSKPRAGRARKA